MIFLQKLRSLLFVLLLYEIVVEVRSRNIERKPKKDAKTKSKTLDGRKIKAKGKGKKQFFPMPIGQAGQFPGSPYPMPEYKPVSAMNQEMKIVKGLPRGYDCSHSQHGCCWDGRTPAFGPSGKGCPQCRDVYKDFCNRTKKLCDCPMVADYCRVTCNLCSKSKSSKTCQSSKHNCCWDGRTPAKGPKGKGCPKIKDDPGANCKLYESECLRNPYYMWKKCRKSCIANLPPIEPFIQGFGPVNQLGIPPPACGQPPMFPGMPAGHAPYPGMQQGMNSTIGKKGSTKNVKQEKNIHSHYRY
ncbi:uncharacterized protein LOC114518760 [Dendronephthya gigantea]|uniref:uncharacterized protein LOC114518760 n=1 Tax=Dendronephthya gigantea TaxID=151771 RepID=UPI00106A7C1C|nr:uncharacterized protein LOC114518760 [Dendronephthya gigantea]